MDGQRVADLSRLYSLVGRVGGHEALRTAWRDYIKATGLKLIKDEEKVGGGLRTCDHESFVGLQS